MFPAAAVALNRLRTLGPLRTTRLLCWAPAAGRRSPGDGGARGTAEPGGLHGSFQPGWLCI